MATRYGTMAYKGIILVTLLALVAAFLVIRPVGAQGKCFTVADNLECTYAENDTGRVYDFHATDPDRGGVVIWTTVTDDEAYPDHGDFEIDRKTGVLTFKNSPDHESSADADTDNTYKVKVKASDGEDTFASIGVTVMVSNLEEPGTVTLKNLQPQVRTDLGYILSDDDDHEGVSGQQWSKSPSRNGSYTPIAGATGLVYSPKNGDIGYYLRVTVTYVDGAGEGHDTAIASSMYPVRALPDESNDSPVFAEGGTSTRKIDENTPAGMNVGPPVVATDANLDVLTYSLGGTDMAMFTIDSATGQIMTKASLNHEEEGGGSHEVTVTATDPSLGQGTSTVTITVVDLNEAPGPIGGPRAIKRVEGAPLTLEGAIYTNAGTGADPDEGDTVTYDVSGTDASVFDISQSSGMLAFKTGKAPNFEIPGDKNEDNIYEVTVVARDSKWATTTKDVTIKVTNMEEGGLIKLSHTHPEIETLLKATLSDPDGGETGHTWQWYRGDYSADNAVLPTAECTSTGDNCLIRGATSSTYTPKTNDDGKTLSVAVTYKDRAPNEDSGDTSDVDESKLPTTIAAASANPVRDKVTSNPKPYFEADEDNDDNDVTPLPRVTVYARTIAEGTDGSPTGIDTIVTRNVAASDPEVTGTNPHNDSDKLQYELGGPDKAYFDLNNSQELITKQELDYDTKRRLTVTVKATDPSGGSATVTVHISVTDDDEAPKIDGPSRVEAYMENGTGSVATFNAKDPERTAIAWSVKNEGDNEDFKVSRASGSSTMLQFKKSPDFETPMGGTDSNSNIYTVTLVATVVGTSVDANDGTCSPVVGCAEKEVAVRVTNVEEAPEFEKTADTLSVKENVDPNTDIDLPVMAKPDSDVDALTYTLGGRDAASFTIIPATGQIKRKEALDHETKSTYSVVVTATDPTGRKDTITITIEVTDVPEKPTITEGGLSVSGPASKTYMENGTGAVATYEAIGPKAAQARWTLEGDDAGDFKIEGSGASVMLKFKTPPNYEDQKDADKNNVYKVTVKVSQGADTDMQPVQVTVTDVDELGTLAGNASVDYEENDTDAVGTYTAHGPVKATWTLEGADAGDFRINPQTGALTFRSPPNYERPADADTDNTYMVTVKAAAGGEMDTITVTITVTDVDELGTPEGPGSMDYAETGTAAVATYTATGTATPAWSLEGADSGDFRISNAGVLTFRTSPNYESPADANRDNVYMVTVKVTGGGEMHTTDVTITVTDVDEAGSVALSPQHKVGTAITATLSDGDGNTSGTTWQWAKSGAAAGPFDDIGEATNASYTPVEADAGMYLRATASYTDKHGSGKSAMKVSSSVMPENTAPAFSSETTTRMVAENTAANMNIGAAVTATDADNDTLTYALGGTDMASFAIDDTTGQIMTKADLDHETKDTYMVMVTATDPDGESDSVTVTVTVTDVDEVVTLKDRYDANDNGKIDREEVLNGIDAFFTPPTTGSVITREQVLDLIDLFFAGLGS